MRARSWRTAVTEEGIPGAEYKIKDSFEEVVCCECGHGSAWTVEKPGPDGKPRTYRRTSPLHRFLIPHRLPNGKTVMEKAYIHDYCRAQLDGKGRIVTHD